MTTKVSHMVYQKNLQPHHQVSDICNLSGRQAKTSRPLMTSSNPAENFRGVSTFQHLSIGITIHHTDFMHPQGTPWKQIKILSFYNDQHTAEVSMLSTPNLVLQSQHLARDSKSEPTWKPTNSETTSQACFATTQSKSRW
jgi:hypothetical protein